jgi:hypothetical protein
MEWLRCSWVTRLLKYVLTLLRVEEPRSAEAFETGAVKYNWKSFPNSRNVKFMFARLRNSITVSIEVTFFISGQTDSNVGRNRDSSLFSLSKFISPSKRGNSSFRFSEVVEEY